jgi:hypothetical protein
MTHKSEDYKISAVKYYLIVINNSSIEAMNNLTYYYEDMKEFDNAKKYFDMYNNSLLKNDKLN